MVPAQTNRDVAGHTTDELLFGCPEKFGIKKFLRGVTVCLLDERVRIAMMLVSHSLTLNLVFLTASRQPAQPWYLHALVRSLMRSVAFFQGWFCLPRIQPKCIFDPVSKPAAGPSPRMHPRWFLAELFLNDVAAHIFVGGCPALGTSQNQKA